MDSTDSKNRGQWYDPFVKYSSESFLFLITQTSKQIFESNFVCKKEACQVLASSFLFFFTQPLAKAIMRMWIPRGCKCRNGSNGTSAGADNLEGKKPITGSFMIVCSVPAANKGDAIRPTEPNCEQIPFRAVRANVCDTLKPLRLAGAIFKFSPCFRENPKRLTWLRT